MSTTGTHTGTNGDAGVPPRVRKPELEDEIAQQLRDLYGDKPDHGDNASLSGPAPARDPDFNPDLPDEPQPEPAGGLTPEERAAGRTSTTGAVADAPQKHNLGAFAVLAVLVLLVLGGIGYVVLPFGSSEPAETPVAEVTQSNGETTTANTGGVIMPPQPGAEPAPASADAVASETSANALIAKLLFETSQNVENTRSALDTLNKEVTAQGKQLNEEVVPAVTELKDRVGTLEKEDRVTVQGLRFELKRLSDELTSKGVPVSAVQPPASLPSQDVAQNGGSGQGTSGGGSPPPATAQVDEPFRTAYVMQKCGNDVSEWPAYPWPVDNEKLYKLVDEYCSQEPFVIGENGERKYRPGEEPTYAPVSSDPEADAFEWGAPDAGLPEGAELIPSSFSGSFGITIPSDVVEEVTARYLGDTNVSEDEPTVLLAAVRGYGAPSPHPGRGARRGPPKCAKGTLSKDELTGAPICVGNRVELEGGHPAYDVPREVARCPIGETRKYKVPHPDGRGYRIVEQDCTRYGSWDE